MSQQTAKSPPGHCDTCVFWSELVARSVAGGPLEALCEADGTRRSQYTTKRDTCESWEPAT